MLQSFFLFCFDIVDCRGRLEVTGGTKSRQQQARTESQQARWLSFSRVSFWYGRGRINITEWSNSYFKWRGIKGLRLCVFGLCRSWYDVICTGFCAPMCLISALFSLGLFELFTYSNWHVFPFYLSIFNTGEACAWQYYTCICFGGKRAKIFWTKSSSS